MSTLSFFAKNFRVTLFKKEQPRLGDPISFPTRNRRRLNSAELGNFNCSSKLIYDFAICFHAGMLGKTNINVNRSALHIVRHNLEMSLLSERIKELSANMPRGWQAALARHCHVKPPSVADWLSGKTLALEGENLLNAASFFKVNPTWLATGKGRKELQNSIYSVAEPQPEYANIGEKLELRGRVPLISYVAAGNWSESVDNFHPGDSDEWIATTIQIKKHTYGLRVQGDSMEPKFPSGAIIIVEPEEEARNGSYVIVRQNGNEATFKQLVIDGGQHYLKPLNDRYPIMQMLPDATICGVVKQMVMDIF